MGSFRRLATLALCAVASNAAVAAAPAKGPAAAELLLSRSERQAVKALFAAKQFKPLSERFKKLQEAFDQNPLREGWLIDAVDTIAVGDPGLEGLLDAWVKADPDGFPPYLVRGAWWVAIANSRRAASVAEVKPALLAATKDLQRALALRPELSAAQRQLIVAARLGGDEALGKEAYERALAHCPTCFHLRVARLHALQPRWGGSHEAMQALAAAAPVAKNPALRLLPGFGALDLSEALSGAGKHPEALVEIEKACALGEYWEFLLQRGTVYARVGKLAEAERDLTRAEALAPPTVRVLAERAQVRYARRDYLAGGQDLIDAQAYDPHAREVELLQPPLANALLLLAEELGNAGLPEKGLRAAALASGLAPGDPRVEGVRPVALRAVFRLATTEQLKARARNAPRDLLLAQALADRLGQESDAVASVLVWTLFLKQNPEHAVGHFSRAQLQLKLGDVPEGVADLKRACALGMPLACEKAKEY